MPTINMLPKKKRQNTQRPKTEERELRQKMYNTTAWRKCREAHLVKEPLCQNCLKEGRVFAGSPDNLIQVHHKVSPFKDGQIDWNLALDDDNLMTLCSECHGKLHAKEQGYVDPEEIIKALDALFEEVELENEN